MDVSAIIGKNSTGKTTILKLINNILGSNNASFQYIAVFETKNQTFDCYYRMNTDIDIAESCIGKKVKVREYMCLGDVLSFFYATRIIYFSNIFDKNKPLQDHEYLIDISTNNELKKYISSK